MAEAATNGGRQPACSRRLRASRLISAAALVLVAVLLLGCGSDDDSDADNGSVEGLPPNVVTDGDIEDQEDGTPERALLEWWQAFQFQDVAAVEALTSTDTLDAIGEGKLEDLVEARGQGLQGIEVLGTSEEGDTASVRAGLLTFQAEEGEPPPTEPTGSTPTTFAMKEEDGEWLFDQTAYLQTMVEELAAAEEQAKQEQAEGEQGGE